MGKFDGFLICSDFDNTFAMGGVALQENIEAVRYFNANGGRFTFATGRTKSFVAERNVPYELLTAPACLNNGSVVYDYATDSILRERRLPFTVEAFFEALGELAAQMQGVHLFPAQLGSSSYYTEIQQIPENAWQQYMSKFLLRFETQEKADAFKKAAMELPFFKNTYISKSWSVGVEFNASDATKGHALRFIKQYLENIHTAVGIGDYENDVPLVAYADIGVAVGSAQACVKQAAKWIVCPCKEGALRELVERLETVQAP